MGTFLRIVDSASEWTGKIASFMVMLLTLAIGYDIFMRYFFAKPSFWAYDMTIMIYGSYTMLGAAYCHLKKGHVRMDLLYGRLSPRGRAITDVICYVLLFFPLFIVLVYKVGEHALWALESGERASASSWRPPLAPFKLLIAYGFLLFLFQGLAEFLKALIVVVRGGEYDA
jgi:TRAP-type mannitol/chloroaromatic compound transport system permease small subunit